MPMIRNGEEMPPITIEQSAFFQALQVLKHVSDAKSSMPVLRHVLLEGCEDCAAATTTDVTNTLTCTFPGRGEGAYLLPIKQTLALAEPDEKPVKPKKGQKAAPSTREITVSITPEEAKRHAGEWAKEQTRHEKHLAEYVEAKARADRAKTSYVEGFGSGPPSAPSPIPIKVVVETPDVKGSMPSLDVDDFPAAPKIAWSTTRELDIAETIDTMEWIMLAVSTDEGRPYLNGMLFTGGKEPSRGFEARDGLVSTDGHRLHAAPFAYDGDSFLLARKTAEHLLRVLKLYKTGKFLVSAGSTATFDNEGKKTLHPWVRFDCEPWSLVARAVDARFPPYDKVIPKLDPEGASVILRMPPEKLAAAVRRVQKVVGEKHATMRMHLDPSSGAVTISGENVDADANLEVEVAAEYVAEHLAAYAQIKRNNVSILEDDGTMLVGFNARYMVEAMKGMGESTALQFHEPADGCRIDGENGRLAVTMPQRL
jgi:DNA polymerase III sliding clamp (beta) subunit (PCNA family)